MSKVIPVKFGTVSGQVNTVSVGIKIQRDDLPLDKADKMFANHRLTVQLESNPNKRKSEEQQSLEGVDQILRCDGVCDVKSYSAHADYFTVTASFVKSDVSGEQLIAFSHAAGKLHVADVGNIPESSSKPTSDE